MKRWQVLGLVHSICLVLALGGFLSTSAENKPLKNETNEHLKKLELDKKKVVTKRWKELGELLGRKKKKDLEIEKEAKKKHADPGQGEQYLEYKAKRMGKPDYKGLDEGIKNLKNTLDNQFENLENMYKRYGKKWPSIEHFEKVWGKKKLMRDGCSTLVGQTEATKAVEEWLRGLKEEAELKVLRKDSEKRKENILEMYQELSLGK